MLNTRINAICMVLGALSVLAAGFEAEGQAQKPVPRPSLKPLTAYEESFLREEFARSRGGELGAIDFAVEYGQRTVPLLVQLLKENHKPENRGKIALYLGKCGGENATQALVESIESPLPAVMEKEHYNELASTIRGLGYAATDGAVTFLNKLMTEEYWLQRKDLPREGPYRLDISEQRLDVRKEALYALGCTLREDVLTRLKQGDDVPPDLAKDVAGALSWAKITKDNEDNLRRMRQRNPPPADPRLRSQGRENRISTSD